MLHSHNLDHVQIGLRWGIVNGEDGIDNAGCKLLGESLRKFRCKSCAGDGKEKFPIWLSLDLEFVEELRKQRSK